MMTQRNVELQLQALDVIEGKHLTSTASSVDDPNIDIAASSASNTTVEQQEKFNEIIQEEIK